MIMFIVKQKEKKKISRLFWKCSLLFSVLTL